MFSPVTTLGLLSIWSFLAGRVVAQDAVAAQDAASTQARPSCRCTPTDSCWPSQRDWDSLKRSVEGNLMALRPVAAACHDPTFDQAACQAVSASYTSAQWRSDQPAALQQVNWETYPPTNESCYLEFPRESPCQQGRVSVYSVTAKTAGHIQAAVQFASRYNLRVAIKNTGHDWLGRSAARSSLQIWTHQLKEIMFSDNFSPRGCRTGSCRRGSAVTIGAGVQLRELYQAAKQKGLTVVAGGGGSTIGAAGGYIQGGGHSLLGNLRGMSSDNTLEFELVTASGSVETANEFLNPDLFWALRGGGGGTYGVVTKVTIRTFPDPPVVNVNVDVKFPSAGEGYWSAVQELQALLPAIDDAGGSGFFYLFPNLGSPEAGANFIAGFFFANKTDVAEIQRLWEPFETKVRAIAGSTVSLQFGAVATFTDALFPLLGQTDNTVPITLFGTRLISRDFFLTTDGPKRVTDTLASLRHPPGLSVIGLVVAGGQVARNGGSGGVDSALNPAWRRTLLHVQLLRGWTVDTPFEQQAEVARNLTEVEVPLLKALEGADQMGVYFNEADPNEPNWQRDFFGPNYARLKAIKEKVDPKTLFVCRRCVGSEAWDDEGLCRVR